MLNSLEEIEAFLRLTRDMWDILLFGDGSGTTSTKPGGWSCIAIEQRDKEIIYHPPLTGAVSYAPINWLEALPYWTFLHLHYFCRNGKEMCETRRRSVHIVTDSEWTAKAMSGVSNVKKHIDMRFLYEWYGRAGYDIYWHHAPREQLIFQSVTDKLSAAGREYISAVEVPSELSELI